MAGVPLHRETRLKFIFFGYCEILCKVVISCVDLRLDVVWQVFIYGIVASCDASN